MLRELFNNRAVRFGFLLGATFGYVLGGIVAGESVLPTVTQLLLLPLSWLIVRTLAHFKVI